MLKRSVSLVTALLGIWVSGFPPPVVCAADPDVKKGSKEADFLRRPTAMRNGEKVRISFAVSDFTDVEVSITDVRGSIVRYLGAGVLGPNAPDPFTAGSLVQTIEWDGRDDDGSPARNGPFKAVVGLGLQHRFDRIIGWNPKGIRKIYSLAVGPGGKVYVLWTQPETVAGPPQIAVLDRNGNYERTILPYPANMPAEKMAGIKPICLADGSLVPRIYHGLGMTFYPWLSGTCRQTMAITARGKLVMATGYFNYSTAGSMGPRRLLRVNLDGSCPDSFEGPLLDKRLWNGRPVEGYVHLASSPDGRFIYACGLYESHDWAKVHTPSCVILRARADGGIDEAAEVLFGEKGEPGSDDKHLNDPRGLAVDGEGNLLVADHGNQRIVKIDPAGRFLGEIKAQWPDQIAVNRRTGAIYVVSVDHGTFGPFDVRGWQSKRLLKLKSWQEPVVVALLEGLEGLDVLTIALDDQIEPAVLWFTRSHPNTYHGSGHGLFRCVDAGDSFSKPVAVLGPEAGGTGLAVCGYVAADPVREQIHVRGDAENSARAWLVFDGRTGAFLGFSNLRPVGEERTFDSRGFLYTIFGAGSVSNAVGRWGAERDSSGLP
ncbi:MAG: hypothetical protein N2255_07070, partial [Kiritimatiellae bacterium]|nr:hypothetical protein [Kiritimatiellia bacterium]